MSLDLRIVLSRVNSGTSVRVLAARRDKNEVAEVESDIGPIEVVVFNLGAQTGNHTLADTSIKAFEVGWRVATLALFRTAKAVFPHMQARGSSTLIVTSATAAMRGNAQQHAHTAAMSARRTLCQSLNAEFSADGIHVAHVLIDGLVDAPDTVGVLGEERYQALRDPQLAHQHRSAWTFEMDLRAIQSPGGEYVSFGTTIMRVMWKLRTTTKVHNARERTSW